MQPSIDTKRACLVEAEAREAYVEMFPHADSAFVSTTFAWAEKWFTGHYADYQAIDAHYHDMEHTLQGLLCMVRILRHYQRLGLAPALDQRTVELGILAMLMHDTGYLKKRDDIEGTGAKYTSIHVERSVAFARGFLAERGFPEIDIHAIQNMIHCTGVVVNLAAIPFQNPSERVAGHALGSADLLGQMAAPDYVDKLPVLYLEFAEAARYNTSSASSAYTYANADELLKKTPGFWESFVLPKLNNDFKRLYRVLNDPYPNGHNVYIDLINANIARVRRECGMTGPAD